MAFSSFIIIKKSTQQKKRFGLDLFKQGLVRSSSKVLNHALKNFSFQKLKFLLLRNTQEKGSWWVVFALQISQMLHFCSQLSWFFLQLLSKVVLTMEFYHTVMNYERWIWMVSKNSLCHSDKCCLDFSCIFDWFSSLVDTFE